MKQELVETYASDSLAVIVVWSPMMETDNETAAREAARMFDDDVRQFYDPTRRVGRAYRAKVFPDAGRDAVASLPDKHWLHVSYPEMEESFSTRPEWDIYMFYEAGVRWEKSPPRPARFIRHIGRFDTRNGNSVMWIDSYANAPREGSLADTLAALAREILRPGP